MNETEIMSFTPERVDELAQYAFDSNAALRSDISPAEVSRALTLYAVVLRAIAEGRHTSDNAHHCCRHDPALTCCDNAWRQRFIAGMEPFPIVSSPSSVPEADSYPCMAPIVEGEFDPDGFCHVPRVVHGIMQHPFTTYPERPAFVAHHIEMLGERCRRRYAATEAQKGTPPA